MHRTLSQNEHYGTCLVGAVAQSIETSSPTLRRLCSLFGATTGLGLHMFSDSGGDGALGEVESFAPVAFPRFCELVKSVPEGAQRCAASHRDSMARALHYGHPIHDYCHAGLLGFFHALPVPNRTCPSCLHAGCAVSAESDSETIDAFLAKVGDLGFTEERVLEVAEGLPRVASADFQRVKDWLELAACYLSEISTRPENEGQEEETQRASIPSSAMQLREAVARRVGLPPVNAGRCRGCTPAVIDSVSDAVLNLYFTILTTQLVARALGFEPSYFGKKFTKHRGISLSTHLRRVRLVRARELLANPYLSVAEIAERTGFSGASYFARVFRKEIGISPSEYRDMTNVNT